MPCKDKSRGQGNASTSQGRPSMASKLLEARKWHGTESSSQFLESAGWQLDLGLTPASF